MKIYICDNKNNNLKNPEFVLLWINIIFYNYGWIHMISKH